MDSLNLEGKRMSYKVNGTTCIVEHYHRFEFPMHFCDMYEYLHCRGGRCSVVLQGQEMTLGGGESLMIFPGQIHGVRLLEGELYLLTFSPNLVPEFDNEVREKAINNRRVFRSAGWFDPARIDALMQPDEKLSASQVFLQAVTLTACSDFLGNCELNRLKKKNDIYTKALNYIQKHYRHEISLGSVAKAVNTNKDYLCRLMKQNGGIGFLEYVNQLRLNYAVALMQQNPDIRLSDVATESGFGTMRAFDMVFSQYYGAPPKKYRQTAKAPFSGTHWVNSDREMSAADEKGKTDMKKMKLKVAVRDGKKLVTFVYLPGDGIERYAGVFLRNPYVEDTAEQEERNENMIRPYVEAGFAVILQHCRGRGGSEGDFIPFAGEREDGLDTIAWIEKQEWFDGRLYLWGGSYLTYVHLSYMDALPACVKGACLAVMAADCRLAFYKGGAFKADLLPPWYTSLYHPGDHPGKDGNACRREYFAPNPLSEFSLRTYGYAAKPLDDLIAGSATGEYGAPGSFSDAADSFKNLQIPVRIIDGWGEMFLGGMEKMWQELPEETRKKSAFVIGPWSHALNTIMPDWKYDFGQNAGIVGSDLGWLLWLRDGKPLGDDMKLGKLNYFHVGKNVWETADDFTYLPRNKTLYLCKDGTLGDARPEDASLSYTFDPNDPASFPGGPNSFATGPQGFAPQPEPDFRPDVKSFLTAPLAKEMTLAGRIGVELDVSSDCEATMFVARVSCVDKAGVATVMQDAVALTGKILPGKPTHLSFETDVLCWTLLPGERLRLDISSADAHSYRVHTNMPGDWFTERESRVAVNTLHLGESCLKLPAKD